MGRARYGSGSYLRLDDEETLFAASDVPALDATLMGTGSCQTVRPWGDDSIAVGFIDQGAAAYSGFAFSPNEGYLFGEFDSLPYRYSWPGFPIGHIVQVQSRGTLQGFAHFPYLFLLGDPRIALQTEAPYHLAADEEANGVRTMEFQDVPAGVIPIRVDNGAAYRYIEVLHGPSASQSDPFYNSRLQMADIGPDKFVLLLHDGRDFTLSLRTDAPWHLVLRDTVLDSLDYTLLFSQQTGGDIALLLISILPLCWVAWLAFKKRQCRRELLAAMSIGLAATIGLALYDAVRLDQVSIISKAIEFRPLCLLAVFVLVSCGAPLYLRARSTAGKVAALLLMTAVAWLPMLFGVVMVAAFNFLVTMPRMGTPLYYYSLATLSAVTFVLLLVIFGVVLRVVDTRLRRDVRPETS